MSATQRGYIGLGTKLSYSEDDGTTWKEIARVAEISGVGFGEAEEIDVTGYDTPTRVREKIKGMEDAGSVDLTGIWTADTSQIAIMSLDEVIKWKFELPFNLGEIALDGFISAFAIEPAIDDRIEWSATLVISGKPELTIPTP